MQSPLEAFIEWKRSKPDDVLVEYLDENGETRTLTVDGVWNNAIKLAAVLVKHGGQDQVVGLNLQLEPDLVVCFYACWLAGMTPTVFNLAWSDEIRNGIIARLDIRIVLFTKLDPENVRKETTRICVNDLKDNGEKFEPRKEPILGLINQSSGTTGLPKSVPVRMAMYAEYVPKLAPNMIKGRREAFVTAPSFSGVTAGIYLAPYSRATMIYPRRTAESARGASAQEIATNIRQALERETQALFFTASLFGLADAQMPADLTFPNLQSASFGGELTPLESVRRARKRFPNAAISIGFSSTESVQASFSCVFAPTDDIDSINELLFTPNPNIEELVLMDEDDQPVELVEGAHGRICVVTKASAEPYIIDKGDQDAEAAVNDTFRPTAKSDTRLICFGDYGEYRQGHKIVVFGRTGRKIKINGVFVDLGFLDRTLSRMPSIVEATTLAVRNRIVCLFIPRTSELPTLDDFNESLSTSTQIALNQAFPIEKFPIASSGKMDWKALQAMAEELSNQRSYPPVDESDEAAQFISEKLSQLVDQPYLKGRDFTFVEIGLDSITAAHLSNQLRRKFPKSRLNAESVMDETMTPTKLSSILSSQQPQQASLTRKFLLEEVEKLSSDLPRLKLEPPSSPQSIVLTGATGYLGSFILVQLLQKYPTAKIYCIVRSKGSARLHTALASTQLDVPADSQDRVIPLQGDLALPNLGMSDTDIDTISNADLIIHNAAAVHWTKSYNTLLPANVLSLVFLLKHAKSLTFVSGGGQTALDAGQESSFVGQNGYTQTKYVAEGICRKVGARVVRPGYILGDPVCNTDDFLWRFVKTCVRIGAIVKIEPNSPPMNAATVNDVADHVINAKDPLDRIWVQCHLQQFYDALKTFGYRLEEIRSDEWLQRLDHDFEENGTENPLFPLIGFIQASKDSLSRGMGYPRPSDLKEVNLETSVLTRDLQYLCDIGWLPLPNGKYSETPSRNVIKRST